MPAAISQKNCSGPTAGMWERTTQPKTTTSTRTTLAITGHATRPAPCEAKYKQSARPKNA